MAMGTFFLSFDLTVKIKIIGMSNIKVIGNHIMFKSGFKPKTSVLKKRAKNYDNNSRCTIRSILTYWKHIYHHKSKFQKSQSCCWNRYGIMIWILNFSSWISWRCSPRNHFQRLDFLSISKQFYHGHIANKTISQIYYT